MTKKNTNKKSTKVKAKKIAESTPDTIPTNKDTIVLAGTKEEDIVVYPAPAPLVPQGFRAPQLDLALIREHLDALTRSPFKDALTQIMGAQPDIENISLYASKYPDRWGQLVAIFARLAGYTPELKIEGTIHTKAQSMSDSELTKELERIRKLLDKDEAIGDAIPSLKNNMPVTPSETDLTGSSEDTDDATDD